MNLSDIKDKIDKYFDNISSNKLYEIALKYKLIKMVKKEFKIGQTFQFGFVKLKCEVGHNRCDGCALFDIDYCENLCAFIGECDAKYRKDKTDVIFVKVEE